MSSPKQAKGQPIRTRGEYPLWFAGRRKDNVKKEIGSLITLADIRGMRKGRGGHLQVRRRRGPQRSTVILVAFLLLGMAIIAYPTFSDWWNQYHQSRAIATYVQDIERISQEDKDAIIAEARDYNARLLQKSDRYRLSDEERAEYERTLNPTGNGVMGYIQINSIGVNLPVYHGLDESVLQIAIGHIEGTSLPVGGESTHAVVSGHRGLPSAKLFTDLDKDAGHLHALRHQHAPYAGSWPPHRQHRWQGRDSCRGAPDPQLHSSSGCRDPHALCLPRGIAHLLPLLRGHARPREGHGGA